MAEDTDSSETKTTRKRPPKQGKKGRGEKRKRGGAAAKSRKVQVSANELPRRTIEQALRVARALREFAGTATWEDIASTMSIAPTPQNKYYLWSAQAYGLVVKDNENYSLSEIGRKILSPINATEGREATVQALLTPVVLSRFFTDYNGSPFPAEEHLGNILERKYAIPTERLAEAKTLIRDNGVFAGVLVPDSDGVLQVRLPGVPTPTSAVVDAVDEVNVADAVQTELATETKPGEFDKICFVITPIGEDDSNERRHANMILKHVIEPVARELGYVARRADQIEKSGLITKQIFEHLAKSKLCVADLSFNNPNAFYELGIRHLCKLPTVQMIRKGDKIPFDVSQGRTIRIDMTDVYTVMESVDSARKELMQHLKTVLAPEYKGEDNPVNTYLPGVDVKLPR
jgi:hypothetical protein